MPLIVKSNTSRFVSTRYVTSNPKVDGKYVANEVYSSFYCLAPPMVGLNGTGYGEIYDAQSSSTRGFLMSTPTANRLYGKLKEEVLAQKGELLTSTLEWKSSLDMISSRVAQIRDAYLAVRKGKLVKASKILKMKTLKPRPKPKSKEAVTSLWLEYWMGWAPLAGDIGLAIKTLTSVEPPAKAFSVAVLQKDDRRRFDYVIKDHSVGAYTLQTEDVKGDGSFAAYAKMKVTNHNLNLADQLGFTNPALTAWQMLPFSFMVDWFANVGTVIGSLTDFAGIEFTDTGTAEATYTVGSARIVERDIEYYEAFPGQYPRSKRSRLKDDLAATFVTISRRRKPGPLPVPRLQIAMLDRLSLTRAATSVSLLVEIFLRK